MTSVLPGSLVQGLITAVQPTGLNLQILGFFNGTIDQFHLPPGDIEATYKVGQKIKARVLYDITPSTPPRFALSLAKHVVSLTSKFADSENVQLQDAYPIGAIVEAVKVVRVEPERGLVVQVAPGLEGFVHVSPTRRETRPDNDRHRRFRKRLMTTYLRFRRRPDLGKSARFIVRASQVTIPWTGLCNSRCDRRLWSRGSFKWVKFKSAKSSRAL